jgi:hypothetical protein
VISLAQSSSTWANSDSNSNGGTGVGLVSAGSLWVAADSVPDTAVSSGFRFKPITNRRETRFFNASRSFGAAGPSADGFALKGKILCLFEVWN